MRLCKRVLVVRFRQMGDAILATPLLNTIRQSFPDAEIDFVLNEKIAPLFEGHPAIHRIISFNETERHKVLLYINKVWKTVHQTRYDVVIDMRSTVNTMLFALFSLHSRFRIGIRKPYTWGVFNHRYEGCEEDESMIDHNLKLAEPLSAYGEIKPCRELTLSISAQEKEDFHHYMEQQGINFKRPVMLVGVTAKLKNKTWNEDRMVEILSRLLRDFPQWQLIFNYAPGKEAENAHRIYNKVVQHTHLSSDAVPLFLNIEAKSARQLAAMSANCFAYFGNEGGARHIVHAMGRPSMVICSPVASKKTWLPSDTNILAWGIDASSVADTTGLTDQQKYDLITVDSVWTMLQDFLHQISLTASDRD